MLLWTLVQTSFLKNNFINSFTFGCAGSSLLCRLFSSCGKRGLLSSCGAWALIAGLPSLRSSGSRCTGFSSHDTWAESWLLGSRAQTQLLRLLGSAYGRSSLIRDQTCVSYVDRWILYPWTTRKGLKQVFVWMYLSLLVGLYSGVELLGQVITVFTLLRNCQTVFQSGCTIVHTHQQHMRVPVSPLKCRFDRFLPWAWTLHLVNTQDIRRRRQWHPTPVLLPGKSHGWRGLVGCSPWGHEELDTTEWLPFHFSLSCTGEGNGNLLQCSCLENPRDGGAWWAAVYGVAQSRTRLKRLSSSSSSKIWGLKTSASTMQ